MSLLIYFAADAAVHADQAHATDDGEVFTERDAFWRERGHTLPPDSSEYILIVFVEEGVAVSGGWLPTIRTFHRRERERERGRDPNLYYSGL
ncbi:hypothetical protein BKA82DRAFT_992860 [Pisolithus tinctorius]|uniref:Uncharacterized protein n=1 Tax=Pisolithus tinctorius Marx 270 TaxID=870435 RepID=A0A0C3PWK0_PISTI|nr:hypothetical protein BKA82DRAFT_992860 [Pisolithus tinctorius]KIO13299.1 hypothetical protein M404DRAFT_992860 [Pisolithus tinctorius Marx 270]